MDAINFLIKEHNQVRVMLADIMNPSHHFETRKKLFSKLSDNLLRHEDMEHTIWYPHFKNEVSDTVKHLVKEEKHAEHEIKKINELKTEEAWVNHLVKFSQDVSHHANEEENKLFPEVREILSKDKLEQIGKEMFSFKQKYSEQ